MPSIYLVIDVQPGFYAADDKNLRRNIQEKLKKAVAEKSPIIFLEYDKHGSTHENIKKIARSSNWFSVLTKYGDDGAVEVLDYLQKNNFSPENFSEINVMGVNTSQCVAKTVQSLHKYGSFKKINLIENCCGDSDKIAAKDYSWGEKLKNLKIVHD